MRCDDVVDLPPDERDTRAHDLQAFAQLGFRPQASAASSLLADALAPEEWATFRHVMTLMRTALEPAHAAANGLTLVSVAALLAEAWFPPLPPFGAAGGRR